MTTDVLMSNFVTACEELYKNQLSFYYYVRNGGTDLSGYHPDIMQNPHIGNYYKTREALETATGEKYTVIPDLVKNS